VRRWGLTTGGVAGIGAGVMTILAAAALAKDGAALRLASLPLYHAGVLAPLKQRAMYRDDVLPTAMSPERESDRRAEANALYSQGLALQKAGDLAGARDRFEQALALEPGNIAIRSSLGYVLYAEGDLEAARAAFQAVLERDPGSVLLYDELGYLNLRLGDEKQADRWFRQAIDHRQAAQAATPEDAEARDERVYRLRSEVAQIENDADLTLYSMFRRGAGAPGAPNPSGRSLTQSQGGLEGAYRLPVPGLGAGRTIQAFGRVLWGYQTNSIRIRSESYQGGVGLRVKPLASQNLVFSFERLVSLGSAARDDWLARAGYSWALGYGFDPFKTSWPVVMVYGDAALAFPTGPDLFLSGEVRAGQSWRLGDHMAITPHLAVLGSRQEDGTVTTTLVEGGPGVSLKYYFDESEYRAFGASAEVLVQYRAKLGGNSTGASGAVATVVLSF
jgi:tetratricopeptide (TPR) repeat protein